MGSLGQADQSCLCDGPWVQRGNTLSVHSSAVGPHGVRSHQLVMGAHSVRTADLCQGQGQGRGKKPKNRGLGPLMPRRTRLWRLRISCAVGSQQGEGGVPETTWERLQGQVVTSCRKGLRTRAENRPLDLVMWAVVTGLLQKEGEKRRAAGESAVIAVLETMGPQQLVRAQRSLGS